MSDRVSVNHCVWLKLEELFQHTLLELKCNVHPLEGISNKIRSTLKVYDNDNGIQSCTFGSDCAVANVIYGLTKMRFKQGTGDPSGFKHFLRCENVKPCRDCYSICRKSIQCFILAGNFFKIKDRLLYYLQNMCYCKNSLKTSLINDLQNRSIIIQLRVLGLIGKFITGPWMKIHYSNSECKANLEMVPVIKMCTMTLRDLIQKPTFFLTAISNVFGEKLYVKRMRLYCVCKHNYPVMRNPNLMKL